MPVLKGFVIISTNPKAKGRAFIPYERVETIEETMDFENTFRVIGVGGGLPGKKIVYASEEEVNKYLNWIELEELKERFVKVNFTDYGELSFSFLKLREILGIGLVKDSDKWVIIDGDKETIEIPTETKEIISEYIKRVNNTFPVRHVPNEINIEL